MKYDIGQHVIIKPNPTGLNTQYTDREGVVEEFEETTIHRHLGGVPQYRVRVLGEEGEPVILLSERELSRAPRRQQA